MSSRTSRVAHIALLAVLACKGDAPTQPTGFSLSIASQQPVVIARGTSQTVEVSVVRTSDFSGAVALRLADGNESVTADPVTITSDATRADLTIHAASGAPPGRSTVTVEGTATGFAVAQVPLELDLPGTGSFSLAVGSYPAFVTRGQTFHIPVNILRADYTGAVTLALIPPHDFLIEFIQPGTGNAGDISLTVGASVPIGSSYALRLTASGPGVNQQEAVLLLGVVSQ